MTQKQKNYAIPLAFVGMMFFSLGFALGINSFLIPVLKDSLSLPSGVAYLLLAATFVPFLIFGYPASKTIAAIGYKRTMALSFLIFAAAFVLFVLSAKQESFPLFLIASFVSGAANAYLQANKGEMSADQIGAAEKVVKAGMEIEEIDATARNILSGTKSLQEALRAVNGVDARIRTKVRTQVRQAYADVESAMKAENQANKKLAWQQLQTQGKIEPTLRAEMFEKDPEALARLDNYAEKQAGGGLKYSDQTVLAGIERLADSDPEEFKRLDILEDFGDKLRAEDIRALQKKQRNIDVEEHKDFLAAVKSAAKVEGVRTADIPKVSLAAEKKWNAWIEGHGGKVPTADEQKRMVETLFRGEDVGLLWNSDLPQWRAIVDNPNTPVSDLASIGWRPTVDDAALSQYAIKELGVVPPESWSGKQREAVVSLYSGNGWPTEIWAEAQKRCAEIQRRRRAEGKPERPLTNAVIEAMAKELCQ